MDPKSARGRGLGLFPDLKAVDTIFSRVFG